MDRYDEATNFMVFKPTYYSSESTEAARVFAQNAAISAERAEQAAATAGYLDVEIVDGDLIYTRTDAVVDVDFELIEGNLVMEAV